jgi:hypothetical protein
MPMQHRLQDQGVRADPWSLFCAECSQKMRVMTATPAQEGRETRTYECVCGHSERINVAIHRRGAATATLRRFPRATKDRYENDCLTFATGSYNQALDSPDDKEPS